MTPSLAPDPFARPQTNIATGSVFGGQANITFQMAKMSLLVTKFLLTVAMLLAFMSCNSNEKSPVEIDFIFPDNFRGIAILKLATEDRERDRHIVRFSADGIGKVYSDSLPVLKWHRLSARFESGDPIQVASVVDEVKPDEVALRRVGVLPHGKESWYVVGTEREVEQVMFSEEWNRRYHSDES